MKEEFLCLSGISKRFGQTVALNDVTLRARRGSIHAILGENGAGKSTLMKVLAGVIQPDQGEIVVDQRAQSFTGPASATESGIVCVFQELSLVPHLTAAENICLAIPPTRWGLVDRHAERRKAQRVLDDMGFGAEIDLDERCSDLPLSKRQIVEIAKAVVRQPRVLILDEATSALPAREVEKVMTFLRSLRSKGMCVLYISHRMHEIDALADTCSVFRSGAHIATFPARSKTHAEIVQMMIGREVSHVYPAKRATESTARPYVEASALRWDKALKGVNFSVASGEIVGLGGLDGQGQRELLLTLGGLLKDVEGSLRIGDVHGFPASPGDASRRCGVALVPEERKVDGLFIHLPVAGNLTASVIRRLSPGGVISASDEAKLIADTVSRLQIKVRDIGLPVATLSGGNQQKVLLGKWLATGPRLLLLMDPTRGIDVGTKQEIYRILRELAGQGMAILLYSSDYDELVGLCDRVVVMYDGMVRAELAGSTLTEKNVLMASMNVGASAASKPEPSSSSPLLDSLLL